MRSIRARSGLCLLGLGAALAVGCGSTKATADTSGAEGGPGAVRPAVAAPTEREPDAGLAARSLAEIEAQVEAAVQYAFGLEAALFTDADAIASQAEVAAHFRQGFAASLADDLAAYLWDRDRLRTGAPTLIPPDEVVLLATDGTTVAAYFETPPALRQTWALARYTRVELERRGPRWIVTATSQQDARPR